MKSIHIMIAASAILVVIGATSAIGKDFSHSTTGIKGYDPVAYFKDGAPAKGDGHYVAVFEDVTYLFASEDNKKTFEANPKKYAPAYGGYCALGVAYAKKIVGDPQAWKIVEGILYLNVDKNAQKKWVQDVPGNIAKANKNWKQMKDRAPGDL